jgi:gamma-glutamyltranspeptidase / glutathione hydrolase
VSTSRPELKGTFGAISSTHWLASAAGMATLERGGNAFDAAVAAGFVLQVVEPHYNGPGGEVSILARSADSRSVTAICGQGPMPRAATIEHFRDLGLQQIPGSGLLPACVPGAFGAWLRLLAEYGTMHLREVLQYAIGYASDGFPMLPGMAQTISALCDFFVHEWPESARIYLPNGRLLTAGSRFCNPALADTFGRILTEAEAASPNRESQIAAAHDAFYQGFVAESIEAFVAASEVLDATGRRNRALLTAQDLADWSPQVEPAVSHGYRNSYQVFKPGPWSQGPVFLQQLALLDGFDLRAIGSRSPDYVHTVIECAKLAFADREAWYGDPLQSDVPIDELLEPRYTQHRRSLVSREAAGSARPGAPGGRKPWLPDMRVSAESPWNGERPEWARQLGVGLPTIVQFTQARGDTCFVGAADRHGNLVAATPSGGWLKCSPAIPGLGFALGTRGQVMSLAEGHANCLAPRRRPRTTLSPTVVERDGDPYIAFGTPGGDRQDQWTLEFFLALVDAGLDSQAATESRAFHTDQVPSSFVPHESRPRCLVLERDADDHTMVADLEARGHEVELVPPQSLGKVCAAGYDVAEGIVFAAASPRGAQPYAVCR